MVLAFDKNIYLYFRVPVILFAVLAFAVLWFGFAPQVGYWPVLMAVAAFMAQQMLFGHGTEARPYIPWLSLSFVFYFFCFRLMTAENKSRRGWLLAGLVVSGLALVTSVGPAIVQVFVTIGLMLLMRMYQSRGRGLIVVRELATRYSAALLLPLLAFLYYAVPFTCENNTPVESADFLAMAAKGDFSLLKGVLRILLAKGPVHLIGGLFMLFGFACYVWGAFRRRASDKVDDALVLLAVAALASALIIGTMVALKHYFFNNRTFIFLICAQSFMLMLGVRQFRSYIVDVNPRALHAVKGFIAAYLVYCSALLWQRNQTEYAWQNHVVTADMAAEFCSKVGRKNHLLRSNAIDTDSGQLYSGFLVRFDDFVNKHCSLGDVDREESYFVAVSTNLKKGWYRHHTQNPGDGYYPIILCDRPVHLIYR